jgi:hypothetical protein
MKDFKSKKSKTNWSTGRILVVAAIVLLVGSGSYQFFSQSSNNGGNTSNLAGVLYSSPTISSNQVSMPIETLKKDKLVFMDIKLDTPQQQMTFKGRVIPLSDYRGGAYLPIVAIYTPQGNLVSGIRVCEPCGSFSFHIVNGKLDCDRCHTQWDLETLTGVSGGCKLYPPPRLPSTLADNASIDLSSLGFKIA